MSNDRQPKANTSLLSALLILAISFAAALCGVAALGAAEHTVNIVGLEFQPDNLSIEVGDTVTWVNDGGFHNVLSDGGTFSNGPPSSALWVYSHTFREGGVFPYHCEVHVAQGMVGMVNVEGIYGDGFDDGSTGFWNSTSPLQSYSSATTLLNGTEPSPLTGQQARQAVAQAELD
jgi:plastocyanin